MTRPWTRASRPSCRPGHPGRVRDPRRPGRAGPRRRRPERPRRRDRGAGGGVGVGQDHARPRAARPRASPSAGEVLLDGQPLDRSARGLKASGGASSWCSRTRSARSTRGTPSTSRSPRASGCTGSTRPTPGPTETELVAAALSSAGLRPPERLFLRYPHELSGGQRQRVLIAGALAMQPQLLIADEPVSSLDASIRGEILALLLKLRETLGLGVLVVTHDLGLAWNIADRIAVMYLGRVVEAGPTEDVLPRPAAPLHPGAALRRPRDRPAWSRSCCAARCPTRRASRRAAGSTRAARRWPTGGRGGRRRRRLPRHGAARPARGRRGTTCACHLVGGPRRRAVA